LGYLIIVTQAAFSSGKHNKQTKRGTTHYQITKYLRQNFTKSKQSLQTLYLHFRVDTT